MKVYNNAGTLAGAIYTPPKWRNVKDAPKDGTPIIMRSPAWSHDLVVAWEPLYGQQSEDDPTDGWVWKQLAIEKNGIPAEFSERNFEPFNERTTKWAIFGPTPKAMKALEHMEALADLETTNNSAN